MLANRIQSLKTKKLLLTVRFSFLKTAGEGTTDDFTRILHQKSVAVQVLFHNSEDLIGYPCQAFIGFVSRCYKFLTSEVLTGYQNSWHKLHSYSMSEKPNVLKLTESNVFVVHKMRLQLFKLARIRDFIIVSRYVCLLVQKFLFREISIQRNA